MRWGARTRGSGTTAGGVCKLDAMSGLVIAHFREQEGVVIEEDALVGAGAIMLPNVTIGQGSNCYCRKRRNQIGTSENDGASESGAADRQG
jgi:hypothetical protein